MTARDFLKAIGVIPQSPRNTVPSPGIQAAAEAKRLAAFLTDYDLPVEEQRRWRV